MALALGRVSSRLPLAVTSSEHVRHPSFRCQWRAGNPSAPAAQEATQSRLIRLPIVSILALSRPESLSFSQFQRPWSLSLLRTKSWRVSSLRGVRDAVVASPVLSDSRSHGDGPAESMDVDHLALIRCSREIPQRKLVSTRTGPSFTVFDVFVRFVVPTKSNPRRTLSPSEDEPALDLPVFAPM